MDPNVISIASVCLHINKRVKLKEGNPCPYSTNRPNYNQNEFDDKLDPAFVGQYSNTTGTILPFLLFVM